MPINSIVSWIIKKRIHQIDLFLQYPHEVQRDVFKELMQKASGTSWGKQFDFSSISAPETFQERVPLHHYEDLSPFIERMINGEKDLLWPGEINWFAKSSGTTSDRSKLIPVSREALEDCHYKGGKDLLALYFNNNPKNKMYTGKTLIVGGSHTLNPLRDDGSYSGDLSAIIINNLPLWVELRRTPDKSIALMDKWEEKIQQMAVSTMKENVVNISGVPSWTLVLMNRILEISGAENILEIWPNLELYMHGGVNFKPYRKQFEKLIPSSTMSYYETYNASEGFFGLQDREASDDMLLMLDYGIFYEFVPMDQLEKEQPQTLTLDQVEIGKNYALVISTNAGLWRYVIGDTVQFTSLDPYRIQVTGRTKHFINTFGEELIIDNAERALEAACERTQASIKDYTAGPMYMDKSANGGGHEWLIEFEKAPTNLDYFTEVLDNALKALNSDYEAKRSNNLSLGKPLVRVMPENTFYEWLRSKGKLGGQHKIPRLSNHRTIIEEVLEKATPLYANR